MADDPGPDRRLAWLSPNAAALLILAVLGIGLLLWKHPWSTDEVAAPAAAIPADAAAALTVQFAGLSAATTEQEFTLAAGSGPAAKTFAAATWQARDDLGAEQVTFRYLSGGDTAEFANGDTQAKVEIGWPQPGESDLTAAVQLRMRPRVGGTFDVVSAGLGSGQLPVWLAGSVTIDRADDVDVDVLRVGGGDDDVDVEGLAAMARRQVGALAPKASSGRLTVVSAPSAEVAAALLGQSPDAVRQIAAVSTSFDGRDGDLVGPVVVLNPAVFDSMDPRARQVVMSHEATHVLTGAVGSRADTWVIEGFADFVALHEDTESLSVSAGQILTQVREDGPPKALPTTAAFDESSYGLGAVYESAWMVFRMLGAEFGDADVIAFYRSVLDGTAVDDASTAAFGLTTAEITARWQDYLTKSASTVS